MLKLEPAGTMTENASWTWSGHVESKKKDAGCTELCTTTEDDECTG